MLSRDELKTLLKSDKKVKVVIEKADKTIREMICTLNVRYIKEEHKKALNSKKKKTSNLDIFVVFDIEKDSWRSFNFNSVVRYESL